MKRTLSVLLPLLGLSLTACGWDKSPSPARSLSGYFSTCATATKAAMSAAKSVKATHKP